METYPRKSVLNLIQQLSEASRRPLFVDIALLRSNDAPEACSALSSSNDPATRRPELSPQTSGVGTAPMDTTSERSFPPPNRRSSTVIQNGPSIDETICSSSSSSSKLKTWSALLSEACDLVTFMTDEEHGRVLRIVAILFLGFLLPYSTGNDFYLLQNTTRRPSDTEFLADVFMLDLTLEERLEKSVTRDLAACQYGEDASACLTHPDVELAFDVFVEQMGRLLQLRPVHRQEVDLIHLLAMGIEPSPEKVLEPNPLYASNPAWLRTQALMESIFPSQFQINYGHRLRLAELIRDCLVLPEDLHETSGNVVAPLLFGSLLHLRSSLRSFTAQSQRDAATVLAASAAVAAQSRSLRLVLKPEWDYHLNLMLEEAGTDYLCNGFCHCVRSNRTGEKMQCRDDFFCPHSARGQILGDFILRSCRSRGDVDSFYLLHMCHSLTDAIEWQADCWIVKEDDEDGKNDEKTSRIPCLLASLLHAANQLFFFQTPLDDQEVEVEEDPFKNLILCSIQLLRHPDRGIVEEAGTLLVHAFSNAKCNPIAGCASLLLGTIKMCLEGEAQAPPISTSLASVISSQSPSVASALFGLVMKALGQTGTIPVDGLQDATLQLLPAISLNCPHVARNEIESLIALLKKPAFSIMNRSRHILAAILSSRMACLFVGPNDKTQEFLRTFIHKEQTGWTTYQLMRLSMQTGNFAFADVILESLLAEKQYSLSETNYLWLSLMKKIATAESLLASSGAMGIPAATVELQAAVSYIESLGFFSVCWKECQEFQRWFLLLRLDFLDLVTVLRQLTREMRLTGTLPAKNTRPFLHLRNVVRSFDLLSSRYESLKQRHGLSFQDHQSRACIDILQTLASFMAVSTKSVFSEYFMSRAGHKDTQNKFQGLCNTDMRHPVLALIRRLDELIIQPMSTDSLDPVVRAAAMLELIDGVLKVSMPFPRDFFAPQPTPHCEWKISAAPDDMDDFSGEAPIQCAPLFACTFSVTGHIPNSLMRTLKIPTFSLLVWYRIVFACPLEDDEEINKDEDAGATEVAAVVEPRIPHLSRFSAATTAIFPSGHFFCTIESPPLSDEGNYKLEVTLGCRDAKGNDWEMPMVPKSQSCSIRVARSR